VLQVRPVGHTTNCGAGIAPSTKQLSPILARSLASMLPLTLPRTTTDFPDNSALILPVGPTARTGHGPSCG